jgi:non-ribosomal peptide synthetase component F
MRFRLQPQFARAGTVKTEWGGHALRSLQVRLSGRKRNEQANRLAHKLAWKGIKSETPVAVLTERSVEMLVARLAILKAGRVYLPYMPHSRRVRAFDHGRSGRIHSCIRIPQQTPEFFLGHKLAIEEMDFASRVLGKAGVVRDHANRGSLAVQLLQQFHYGFTIARI